MKARLAPDTQTIDNTKVARPIFPAEIPEVAATLADEHEKTATAGMILLVLFEMLSEFVNASREQRHLDLGGTRVYFGPSILRDNLRLALFRNSHLDPCQRYALWHDRLSEPSYRPIPNQHRNKYHKL